MRLAAVMLAVVITALRLATPPPLAPKPPPPKPEYTYIPLAGTPLFDGVANGTHCLALWPVLQAEPNWSLSLVDTEWTVLDGVLQRRTITFRQDGEVWLDLPAGWAAGPRIFYLTESEVREIRGLDRLACRARSAQHDHAHTYYVTYGTGVDDLAHAAPIPADSEMGAVIERIVGDANARYLVAAAENDEDFRLDLIAPRSKIPYRVRVAHRVLTLTRGATELYRHALTMEELVDLNDWNLGDLWEGPSVSDDGWARGTLRRKDADPETIVFDSDELAWRFPHFGNVLARLIEADCGVERCPTNTSTWSWRPPRLVPP